MNEAAAYRQILEDLIRTAQGALKLAGSPAATVSPTPAEILAFKRELRETYHLVTGEAKPGTRKESTRRQPAPSTIPLGPADVAQGPSNNGQ